MSAVVTAPEARLGDAPLVFPRVLADEEGEVFCSAELEVSFEREFEPFECGLRFA